MMRVVVLLILAGCLAGCGAVTDRLGVKDPFGIPKPFEGTNRNPKLMSKITESVTIMVGGIDGMEGEGEDALRTQVAKALQANDIAALTRAPPPGAWLLMGSVEGGGPGTSDKVVITPARSVRKTPKASSPEPAPPPDDAHNIRWRLKDPAGQIAAEYTVRFNGTFAAETAQKLSEALGTDTAVAGGSASGAPVPKQTEVQVAPPHAAVMPVTGAPGDGNEVL
ncbi:MAG TPA: hypothetical protein DCL54_16545, partial [Alphaproteobacteria bacterium]|nr:hypothetical protein [Alphaproteobacteria bacterium]